MSGQATKMAMALKQIIELAERSDAHPEVRVAEIAREALGLAASIEDDDASDDPAYDGDACKCGHSPFDHRGVMASAVGCKLCSCKDYRPYKPASVDDAFDGAYVIDPNPVLIKMAEELHRLPAQRPNAQEPMIDRARAIRTAQTVAVLALRHQASSLSASHMPYEQAVRVLEQGILEGNAVRARRILAAINYPGADA